MFELVGIQEVDFVDQKTGERIQGKTIHFMTEPTAEQRKNGFTGKVVSSKFFKNSAAIPSMLQCGKHYEFIMTYTGGKYPKLVGFKEVKA